MPYIDALRPRLGDVGLVICLDSGASSYDQLAHHQPARHGQRHAQGRDPDRRHPLGRRVGRGALVVSASCARCSTGWKTARLAACLPELPLPGARRPPGTIRADRHPRRGRRRFPWAHYDCGLAPHRLAADHDRRTQALLRRTWEPTLSVTGMRVFSPRAERRQRAAPLHGLQS